jgi:hypothetical protein
MPYIHLCSSITAKQPRNYRIADDMTIKASIELRYKRKQRSEAPTEKEWRKLGK